MGRVRFELTMFLVWRFYRPLASAILHTYPKYVSTLYCNSDNQLPLLLHLLFFFHIFNMLDFSPIGRKIKNIFKNIFPVPFQLIVSQTSLIKFLLYPLEQESSVTFACLTFLLYSFRLDRIFTLHSLLYQDRLYTFSLFFVIICFTSFLF